MYFFSDHAKTTRLAVKKSHEEHAKIHFFKHILLLSVLALTLIYAYFTESDSINF